MRRRCLSGHSGSRSALSAGAGMEMPRRTRAPRRLESCSSPGMCTVAGLVRSARGRSRRCPWRSRSGRAGPSPASPRSTGSSRSRTGCPSCSRIAKEEEKREREEAELGEIGHAQTQGLGTLMQLLGGWSPLPDRRVYRYVILVVLRCLPEPLRAAASRKSAGALSVAGLKSGARLRLQGGDKDG